MKTSIKLLLALTFGCRCFAASDVSVIMKDGKVMATKDGNSTALMDAMTLDNGAKVMTDGTVVMKDGTKTMMKNGDVVAKDGTITKSDDMPLDVKMKEEGGVMMKDGKMMAVKDGKTSALIESLTMHNGAKVMTDGTVTTKDGTKTVMRNGDMIAMDGTIINSGAGKAGQMARDAKIKENGGVMMKDGKM
ncbi:MAG: DUF6799 domain-containing protein, partial [Opitutaceae bacterium]